MSLSHPSVAIIGCGKMGEAMLAGWLREKVFEPSSICIVSPVEEERNRQQAQYGVEAVESVADLAGSAKAPFDIVVFSVKPQTMPEVLDELLKANSAVEESGDPDGDRVFDSDSLFITIAAGLTTSTFENALGPGSHVVRVMPNMPLQVGMGASVVAGGKYASRDEIEYVNTLFQRLGESWIVNEDEIDAVGAISGGGPAYFAYMVEAMADAGEALGLDRDLTEKLAIQTLGGTYEVMKETGISPAELRKSVCSPGGTTLAALASLDDDGFTDSIVKAMKAAVDRAAELRSS